jgi:hypothetical protein
LQWRNPRRVFRKVFVITQLVWRTKLFQKLRRLSRQVPQVQLRQLFLQPIKLLQPLAAGNVVSVPASATPSLSIQISTTTAQGQSYSSQVPIQPTNPAFGSVLKTVQQGSIHVEWDTGIPTESKIFFSVVGGSTRIIPSESGNSTHHIADITGLTQGTHYAYTIEAIAGEQDQKVSGTWRIFCATAGGCVVLSN